MAENGDEIRSLDEQIVRLQKSTRTTIPAMLPLHDVLRHKFRWYYSWSLFKYSKLVHVLFLIGFLIFLGTIFYRINFSEPGKAYAANIELDPNAAGDSTQWIPHGSIGCGTANWCVTSTNDGDTSYVDAAASSEDSYNITNSSQNGVINSVNVYFVARYTATAIRTRAIINSSGSRAWGEYTNLTNSYQTYGPFTWTTKPSSVQPWTWADINDLQIGFDDEISSQGNVRITQIYTQIDYTLLVVPTGAYVDTAATTSLTVHWTDNSTNETGFKIDQQASCAGSWSTVYTGTTVNEVSHSINSGLSANSSYCFRVYAYNGGENSPYSNSARGQTLATKLTPSATLDTATTFRMQGTTTQMTADKAAGSSAATITSAGANASYTNDNGNIITVENSDKARIEKVSTTDIAQNPGGAVRIEEARTNILTYSEAFDNAVWTDPLTRISQTADTTTSPDGTTDADTVSWDVANGILRQGVALTDGATYTFSIWVKRGTATGNFTVDLGDGAAAAVTSSASWARYTGTLVAGASDWVDFQYGGTGTYYLWGAQLELGSFATSYIPTVAAAATRNAEKVQYANTSNLTAGSGTFSAWVKPEWASTDTNNRGLDFYGGIADTGFGTSNALLFSFYTANASATNYIDFWQSGGTGTSCTPSFTANSWHHVSASYQNGQPLKIYWDGSLCNTSAANANNIPTSGNMTIGKYEAYASNNSYFNGLISDFTIFNTALSSNQVRAVYSGYGPTVTGGTANSSSQITWAITDNASNGTGYTYQHKQTADCTNMSGATSAVNPDTGLSVLSAYCFQALRTLTGGPSSLYNVSSSSVSTLPNAPTVTVQAAGSIAQTTATLNGNITATGGLNATERGFNLYSGLTCAGGAIQNPHETDSYGTGAFSLGATSLTSNTAYSYTAYAINTGGTGTSTCQAFTTLPNAPTMTVSAATNNTTGTSATLNGSITSVDGVNATERGFNLYSGLTCAGGAIQNPKDTGGSYGVESFSKDISSLTYNTDYSYKSYAINTGGTGTSSCQTLHTPVLAPVVTVQAVTNNTTGVSVTFNGNITAVNGENATERGFKLYAGDDATCSSTILMNPHETGSYGTGAFAKDSDTPLTPNTPYYFTAYAINTGGTGTSACETFATPTTPTVTVSLATGISATAATLHGDITATGRINPTERGFKIYTNDTCTSAIFQNPHENGDYGTGTFQIASTDPLAPSTDYWYTAYAINPVGTGTSSSCQKFTTLDTTITVSVQAASAVMATGATLNGSIDDTGGANVTRRGFNLYSESQVCGGVPTKIFENGSFPAGSYALASGTITPNTDYSYKAYGLDSGGEEVDSPTCETFLTLAAVPSALTVTIGSWDGSGNPVTVTTHANGNPDATAYYIQAQEISGNDPDPQDACDTANNWFQIGGGDGWNNRADGSSFTDYRTADTYVCYRAKARNSGSAETAYSSTSAVALTAPAKPAISSSLDTYAPAAEITTLSITWHWDANTVTANYRALKSSDSSQACDAAGTTTCAEDTLATNTSYGIKVQPYRGAITGEPSDVKSAYTAIEPVTTVGLNSRTTESLTTVTSDSFSHLGDGTAPLAALQYCYSHITQADAEESLGCDAWKTNANAEQKSSLNVNDQYKVAIQSRNGDSRTSAAPASLTRYTLANAPVTAGHDDTALTTNTIKWTWSNNGVPNPAWTEYCVGDDSHCSTATSQTYSDPAWTANSYHALNIYAKNGNSTTPEVERVDTTTINDGRYTAIETPTAITAGLITPNSIALNMTDSLSNLDVGSSGIQFAETSGNQNGGGETAFTTWPQMTTTTDAGLKGVTSGNIGTTYKYKVKARNADGVDLNAYSGEFEFVTTAGTQLMFQLPGETLDENGGTHLLSYSDPSPSNITAGVPFSIAIDAADGANYKDLAHQDTITLSSTDPAAEFPTVAAMANGAITYNNVILKTVGAQTISGSGSAGSSHEVVVVAGICSATVSTATALPASLDVNQTSTVTITLKDAFGSNLAGHTVSVGTDQAGDVITLSAATTDVNGRIYAYITSATGHLSTITVSDTTDGITLSAHPQITFNQPSVSVPTNFAVKAGDGKVDLTWNNPVGIDHINIYRSTTSGELGAKIQSTSNQSYTDSGLTNGVVYFYTLRSSNAGGTESASTEQLSAQPQSANPADNIPPSVPKNLRALKITATELEIAWDASTDNVKVTGYQIYNADTQVMVGITTDLTYSFANLTPKTDYHFYVRAYDAAQNYSPFSVILYITTLESKDGESSVAAYLILGNVPDTVAAGKSFEDVRVTVADSGGKIISDYAKPVFFASSDEESKLPYSKGKPYTFTAEDAGVHQFSEKFQFKNTGKQTLVVSDNTLTGSKEVNVTSKVAFEETASKVRDFFDKPGNVSRVNTGVVVTSAAVLLAPIVINSIVSLSSILPQLLYWLFQFLQMIGIRRRSKPWGIVYNSQTGQALPLAIVKIFEKRYNRMLERTVTDNQGRYGFLTKPGEFYMTVSKTGFKFPPKEKTSSFYEKVYTGGEFKIAEKDQTVAFNIPLDPVVNKWFIASVLVVLVRLNKILQKLRISLLVLGILFAGIMTFVSYNIVYVLSLLFYFFIIALEVLRAKKARPYGMVTDIFGHPMNLAIVRIYQKSTNRLVGTDVSDSQGRFKFLVSPGVYYITAAKAGYIDYKSHLMYLEKEKTMVSSTIKLKRIEASEE